MKIHITVECETPAEQELMLSRLLLTSGHSHSNGNPWHNRVGVQQGEALLYLNHGEPVTAAELAQSDYFRTMRNPPANARAALRSLERRKFVIGKVIMPEGYTEYTLTPLGEKWANEL